MVLPNDKDLTLRYPLHTVDSSACLLRDTSMYVMTFVFTNILCHHICIVVPCGFSFHSFLSFFEYFQIDLVGSDASAADYVAKEVNFWFS